MWLNGEGEEMTELFEQYGMAEMLCLHPRANIELKGLKRSAQRQFLKLKIEKCVNTGEYEDDEDCKDENEVETFMMAFLEDNHYFIADFLYLNTAFNVKDGEPEVKYVEDKVWLTFSDRHSTEAFLELGNYEIATDVSFVPVQRK